MKKFLIFIAILFFSVDSYSYTSEWKGTPGGEGQVKVLFAGEKDGKILAGLEFQFKENWHTYWKYSGDSGVPVAIENLNSSNIDNIEILWPAAHREEIYGVESFIYKNNVILPLLISYKNKNEPIIFDTKVKYAVCDEVCLFEESPFKIEFNPENSDHENFDRIDSFVDLVPEKPNARNDIKFKKLNFDDKQIESSFIVPKDKLNDSAEIFIIDPEKNFRFPKPQRSYDKNSSTLTFTISYEPLLKGKTLDNKTLEIYLSNGKNSVEYLETAEHKKINSIKKSDNNKSPTTLIVALIAAFLGGLILNIMPCVLPVISLKIFGIVKHGAKDTKYIRKSFFYSTLGIIFSFMILALGVIILKEAGHSIGWGIQFQQPMFIIFLMVLLTLFAANQWGWFEILLPSKLGNKINNAIDRHGDSTPIGNFLTGAFATLLATPCTAPFLTTAVSFAFSGSDVVIVLVFLFMGIGLALPYILIMLVPQIAKIFPRPGAWMLKVKIILGLLLYFTTYWLLYVLFNSGGYFAPFVVAACLHVLLFFCFLAKYKNLNRSNSIAAILWVIFATFAIPYYFISGETKERSLEGNWETFEEAKIPEYIKQGRVVFVDVTADWCLTCKFNKIRVVNNMMDFFKKNNVVLMKADFTKPNETIYNYLVKNGTYAIPFNKIYGPGKSEGIRLKEVLTKEMVRKAVFDAAEKNNIPKNNIPK